MSKVFKETWLITAMFVTSTIVLETLFGDHGLLIPGRGSLTVIAAAVTTLTWWWLIVRRRRFQIGWGLLAGSISAGGTLLVPIFYGVIASVKSRSDEGFGGLVGFGAIMYIMECMILAIPIGAALGALAAFVQKRASVQRPS